MYCYRLLSGEMLTTLAIVERSLLHTTDPIDMRKIARSLSLLLALGLLLPMQEARSQPGLDLENDTLTQSVLIHPPIDAGGQNFSLSTREHTYRSQLRIVDQLARDFSVTKVGEDGIPGPTSLAPGGRTMRTGTDGSAASSRRSMAL